ncbi:MAG: hypothetical protein JSW07_09300, partial [bacterium]
MEKNGGISRKKTENKDHKTNAVKKTSKEFQRNLTDPSLIKPTLTETPFSPRMKDHAAELSEIQFAAQRDDFILRLHQTYGSRYVQRLRESINVNTKLTVSDPNDIHEQE